MDSIDVCIVVALWDSWGKEIIEFFEGSDGVF